MALLDVGHLAGVQLDVGAADPHPLDFHEQLARRGDRIGHFLHRGLAGGGDDERAHHAASILPGIRDETPAVA